MTNRKPKPIRFALIQFGYCVFGAGHTYRGALLDACRWLEPDERGRRFTPKRIEAELIARHGQRVDGSFYVIKSGSDEFDSCLKDQGGYVQRDGNWYSET